MTSSTGPTHDETHDEAQDEAQDGTRGRADRPAELLEILLDSTSLPAALEELVRLAAQVAPGIAACGITVRRQGHPLSVATSDPLAAAVDEIQYGLGTGPCLECLDTGTVLVVEDMAGETRWDGYPAHAVAHGVRSSISFPLVEGASTVGALNAYGREPRLFDADLADRLRDFAGQAQAAVALAVRHARQGDLVDQLHDAMQSRSLIDQALGIVMARRRCTAEEAFAVLRTASQSRNRRLTDVAAELIRSTTGQEPRPGRFGT